MSDCAYAVKAWGSGALSLSPDGAGPLQEGLAWLRMAPTGGAFPVATDEVAYNENAALFNVAAPINGGKLQPDGTWLQEPWKILPAWPQSLPGLAASYGHLYCPSMGSGDGIIPVLSDPALQQVAADNLVTLATTGRFDSPWGGVMLDLEGIPSAYQDELSAFLELLSDSIRSAGLIILISIRGRTSDSGGDYDAAYAYDFSVVAKTADRVDMRCYNFWSPVSGWNQRSIAPHWWIDGCIRYALSSGIDPNALSVGAGAFARYYPISGTGAGRTSITYDQAVQLAIDAGSEIEWIESDDNGLVREQWADLGVGHVWIHSGDTLTHTLDLIDLYSLVGFGLFTSAFADTGTWTVLNEWKA